MTTQATLDLFAADIIDVRDIIARVEELEDVISDSLDIESVQMAMSEHQDLTALLDDLKGNGGDEKWRGDWYPVTLIADCHFTEYAREMLEDCGTIPRDLPSWVEIDWDATARNVRADYTPVEIDGGTYWYR
jgi:hypothetical protein